MLVKFPKDCWLDDQQVEAIAQYMQNAKKCDLLAKDNGLASMLQWAIFFYSKEEHPELDYDFFLVNRKKATTGDFDTKNISLPRSHNRGGLDI